MNLSWIMETHAQLYSLMNHTDWTIPRPTSQGDHTQQLNVQDTLLKFPYAFCKFRFDFLVLCLYFQDQEVLSIQFVRNYPSLNFVYPKLCNLVWTFIFLTWIFSFIETNRGSTVWTSGCDIVFPNLNVPKEERLTNVAFFVIS